MQTISANILALRDRYVPLFASRGWVIAAAAGCSGIIFALLVNYYAGVFATFRAGPSIPDVVLDLVPKVNLSWLHEGTIGPRVTTVLLIPLVIPETLPLLFCGLSALILTRDVFINLTQLGLYHDAGLVRDSFITFGGDLFFSGHVAMPFYLALVYWRIRPLRIAFLGAAFIFGIETLLGHYHYTIDVLAAPFFAFGVYSFVKWLMPQDVLRAQEPYVA